MKKINVAVVGFGNVGQYAALAVQSAEDMELKGIVVRENKKNYYKERYPHYNFTNNVKELGVVDVAILAIPSMSIYDTAPDYLKLGINTVDSYDVHGDKLIQLKEHLHKICIQYNSTSIISAGWDPGTDSAIRAIFEIISPEGLTYTDFGPGMSMGHTVEVKKIDGVRDALSLTVPKGLGHHKRLVYIELESNTDFNEIERKIKSNPYFINDETYVQQVNSIKNLLDYGHGVNIERKGVSSQSHNQRLVFKASLTNPAVTAQVMVNSARASIKQKPGCYVMIEIPLIDFLQYNSKSDIIKRLL